MLITEVFGTPFNSAPRRVSPSLTLALALMKTHLMQTWILLSPYSKWTAQSRKPWRAVGPVRHWQAPLVQSKRKAFRVQNKESPFTLPRSSAFSYNNFLSCLGRETIELTMMEKKTQVERTLAAVAQCASCPSNAPTTKWFVRMLLLLFCLR